MGPIGDDHGDRDVKLRKFIRFAFVAIGNESLVFAESEGKFFTALFTIHRYSSFGGDEPAVIFLI